MTYRAGELRERVTFRRLNEDDDGQGGVVRSWADVATVWAHVRPLSGRERLHSDRLNAEANYLIVIRYRGDLDERDKAVWRGREMNIRFIKDRGPQALFLEIEAEAGVAV